jgi:predicted CoA-binding protein
MHMPQVWPQVLHHHIQLAPNAVYHQRDAVAIGAKTLWLQFGVISPEGARIAEDGGLVVVMDQCMKVEHARHLGRMHWLGFNTGRVTAKRERFG